MKIKILPITVTLLFAAMGHVATAQENGFKAELDAEGRMVVEPVTLPNYSNEGQRSTNQIDGFPLGKVANPTFKNQRGATLADIDNDGQNEIIFGANDSLFVYKNTGELLWAKEVTGFIVLPPAIKDMDGNGSMEIALNTGGLPPTLPPGRVYLMDAMGNDLDGWPKNFDDHWMISGPAIADLDGDGVDEVITSERLGSVGHIHVLKMDGTELNENWPVEIPNTPGFTPSVGDVDGDGFPEVITGSSSSGALYAFNQEGQVLTGFPQTPADASLSYQSPLLLDLNDDGAPDIVGARHGAQPEYYAVGGDGQYLDGWPITAPGWTYAPPSAADLNQDGVFEVFAGNPITETDELGDFIPTEVIFGWDAAGNDLPNFPISKVGGNEGVITIADINNDGVPELIFTSNLIGTDGYGFIHAYSTDGTGELDGFPLRPRGWTFLQSALLDDINNDGNLDLVALTYTSNFGADVDSIFVSAFDLGYPYLPENIYFNAYKGDNTRTGWIDQSSVGLAEKQVISALEVYPNPGSGHTTVILPEGLGSDAVLDIHDAAGKRVHTSAIAGQQGELKLPITQLRSGIYMIRITSGADAFVNKLVVE